jgi:hypothetical protein
MRSRWLGKSKGTGSPWVASLLGSWPSPCYFFLAHLEIFLASLNTLNTDLRRLILKGQKCPLCAKKSAFQIWFSVSFTWLTLRLASLRGSDATSSWVHEGNLTQSRAPVQVRLGDLITVMEEEVCKTLNAQFCESLSLCYFGSFVF